MNDTPRTDADAHPVDAQVLKEGRLSKEEKLDIALQGSMMTSEPPQISEPRTTDDDENEAD